MRTGVLTVQVSGRAFALRLVHCRDMRRVAIGRYHGGACGELEELGMCQKHRVWHMWHVSNRIGGETKARETTFEQTKSTKYKRELRMYHGQTTARLFPVRLKRGCSASLTTKQTAASSNVIFVPAFHPGLICTVKYLHSK